MKGFINLDFNTIITIVFCIVAFLFLVKYLENRKVIVLNAINEINGGPKTGKTFLGLALGYIYIRDEHIKWTIRKFLYEKLHFKFVKVGEEPLIYANIPISNCKYYSPITKEILNRDNRVDFKSLIFLNECSLVATSMDAQYPTKKDKEDYKNESLTNFLQLIGHETHGGKLIFDTQCEDMLHNAFRRTTSSRLFIVKSNFKIPFIAIFKLKELFSCGDNNLNVNNGDLEDDSKIFIVWNKRRIYKMYDQYAYSYLTDDLPVSNKKFFIPKEMNKADRVFCFFEKEHYIIRRQEEKIYSLNYLNVRDNVVVEERSDNNGKGN